MDLQGVCREQPGRVCCTGKAPGIMMFGMDALQLEAQATRQGLSHYMLAMLPAPEYVCTHLSTLHSASGEKTKWYW